jgi:hypothetical protein
MVLSPGRARKFLSLKKQCPNFAGTESHVKIIDFSEGAFSPG